MSKDHSGNILNSIVQEEHRSVNGVNAKATAAYGFDGTNLIPLKTDATGVLQTSGSGGGGGDASAANQTNGNQQTKITDGTNVANTLKSDGTAAGQNSQLVAGTYLAVPFTTTIVAAVGSTDVANYKSVSVHIVTQGTSSTITFQGSNDNTNWVSVALLNTSAAGATVPATGTAGAGSIFAGALNFRYFRVNVTGISAGTTAGTIIFSTMPWSYPTNSVSVGSSSATGSAVPANAFFLGIQNSGSNLAGVSSMAAALDGSAAGGVVATGLNLYNGTNYDRMRANATGAVIAAGATSTQTSATQTTYNASKLAIAINISAFTSGTLTFTVNGITSSGYTYPMLASAALGATGVTVLRIFPGATAAANLAANDLVPRSYQVVVTGTFVATYGVDYLLSV